MGFFDLDVFHHVRVARRIKDSLFFFFLLCFCCSGVIIFFGTLHLELSFARIFSLISPHFYQKLDVFAETFLCMIYVLCRVEGVFIRFRV